MQCYSSSSGIHKKILEIHNRNTETHIFQFIIARWNYFTNRYDYFLKTKRILKNHPLPIENIIPLRLSEVFE